MGEKTSSEILVTKWVMWQDLWSEDYRTSYIVSLMYSNFSESWLSKLCPNALQWNCDSKILVFCTCAWNCRITVVMCRTAVCDWVMWQTPLSFSRRKNLQRKIGWKWYLNHQPSSYASVEGTLLVCVYFCLFNFWNLSAGIGFLLISWRAK